MKKATVAILVSLLLSILGLAAVTITACFGHEKAVQNEQINYNNDNFSVAFTSKQILADYNVVVMDNEKNKACGGTLVETKNTIKVVTAFHCINTEDDKVIPYGFIKVGEEIYRVEVEKFRRAQDLALLKITDKINPAPKAAKTGNTVIYGEPVWIIGYGARQEDILSHGTVALTDVLSRWSSTHTFIVDGSGFYGNSGGGIFNSNDELVGVLIEIGPSGTTGLWMYAVHPSEIIKLLN